MLSWIGAVLCAVIFVRLFTYRRGGARFRRGVSLCAALMMGACGAMVVYILTGKTSLHLHDWPLLVLLGVLAYSLLTSGGNLATVVLSPNWAKSTEGKQK